MNGEQISKALNSLPDDLLEEAMQPYKPATVLRNVKIAVFLVLVTVLLSQLSAVHSDVPDSSSAQGLLSVRVYAADCSTSTTLTPSTVAPFPYLWRPGINTIPGMPITLCVPYEDYPNVTFQVTVNGGGFFVGASNIGYYLESGDNSIFVSSVYKTETNQFTVSNNTTIFWNPTIDSDLESPLYTGDASAYADILIFNDENIIGYAILRFERDPQDNTYFLISMIESVAFTPDAGVISEGYVQQLIQAAKES